MRIRFQTLIAFLSCGAIIGITDHSDGQTTDSSLVLHYTFDENLDRQVKDLSTHGNDGKATEATYLTEVLGRSGVLRFTGGRSTIALDPTESLKFSGDITVEMWVRNNSPDGPSAALWSWGRSLHLHRNMEAMVEYKNGDSRIRTQLTDDGDILSDTWSHLALVVEYPRVRIYQNGELLNDKYMPFPAVFSDEHTRLIASRCLIDLDEFRVYRRALSGKEIAAHAQDQDEPILRSEDLAVEAHWYDKTVTLRATCKGDDYTGYSAILSLQDGGHNEIVPSQTSKFSEYAAGSGRHIATATFPLDCLANKSLDAVARLVNPDGEISRKIYRHVNLRKPDWVDTPEGLSDKLLPPWTPVKARTKWNGTVEIGVWGRKHLFGASLFPMQIEAKESDLLASPITLKGRADGKNITWNRGRTKLIRSSVTAAHLKQVCNNGAATLTIKTDLEFDGYMILDCEVKANRDLTFDELALEIPLHTRHATLCFGTAVYPQKENPTIPMSTMHIGSVDKDLAFRFSPNIWLGDEERGLTWQAESNEYWRCSDPQKAIEILPSGNVTTFRANWINMPTKLTKGQTLHYKFALQATPVKPMLRDSWDLRLIRSGPYVGITGGNPDLTLPDRWVKVDHEKVDRIYSVHVDELNLTEPGPGRQSALDFYADMGIRHLWISANDNWPWPWPTDQSYARKLRRLINHTHASGMKIYSYLIHERMPTNVPEFDIHGRHMGNYPFKPYNGVTGFCPKSKAAQDAIVHNFAKRLDEFGDDGVYLDGTGVHLKNCQNRTHGCGYLARKGAIGSHGSVAFDQTERGTSGKDGKVLPTYPVFADREILKRLYTVVKTRRPDGVVDIHSWQYNSGGLAYGDILWTGEQWFHLRGKGTKYVSEELTLDMFRAGFMGYQFGVAAEMLPYRLIGDKQTNSQVAAISLLHDVPVRVRMQDTAYLDIMSKLWEARDQFDIKHAEKLFYWNNQDYVTVHSDQCHVTLFKHPRNGVWVFVSNLSRETQSANVHLNLNKLGLAGKKFKAFNLLTNQLVGMSANGRLAPNLGSEQWIYIWLKPDNL